MKLMDVQEDEHVGTEDLSQVNAHSLSTILQNDLSTGALEHLDYCLDRKQRGGSPGGGGGDIERMDTREYLWRANKLVKALQFKTNRLVLNQDQFHAELRLDSDQQVELVKDATFYFKASLNEHTRPLRLYFDYFDLVTGQVLRKGQALNIIQVYTSQLNPKPRANNCQTAHNSPTTVEISGAFNAKDRTKLESPQVFIAVQCYGKKAEDILLKLRLRAQDVLSAAQNKQQKAEHLKAAVEDAKLKNTMLQKFGNKLLHNIGQGQKAPKIYDPAEIAI